MTWKRAILLSNIQTYILAFIMGVVTNGVLQQGDKNEEKYRILNVKIDSLEDELRKNHILREKERSSAENSRLKYMANLNKKQSSESFDSAGNNFLLLRIAAKLR